jgi:hypothetical protein
MTQIRAHAYLGNRDHVRLDHRIMNLAAREHGCELVPDQFADPELTL